MRVGMLVWGMGAGCTGQEGQPPEDVKDAPTDGIIDDTGEAPTDGPTDGASAETGTPGPTADTGEPAEPPPVVLSADCALTDNALRVTCTATLDREGPVTLELSSSSSAVPARIFESAPGTEHTLLGWGLLPETTYDWRIGELSGQVTTGALPERLRSADIDVTGTSWGFDAVLHPMSCAGADYFTMIDGQGRIVWYEENDVFFTSSMAGYEWSQAARTVLSVNSDTFLEQDVAGNVVLELWEGVDFDHSLHHDTERWGDYRYLLFERPYPNPGGTLDIDGIHVFEGNTLLGTFYLDDHFTVGQGRGDWSHGNGLQVTETGELILSLLNFDTVVSIDGDPASPTFLEVNWHAVGTSQGLPGADYTFVSGEGEGFNGQHNASRHGDELWLFDNRGERDSRAARFLLDDALGTLALDRAWSFEVTCHNQGGALPLTGGGVLATCANEGQVWAFEEALDEPSWTLQARCGDEAGLSITRAIPVFIR